MGALVTAAVITLAIALALAVGEIVVLALTSRSDTKSLSAAFANERVDHANTRTELERKKFELEVTQKALAAANQRATALEEVLQDEINSSPNPDLARTDVRSRVLRLARKWSEAATTRSPLPADAGKAVPDESTAHTADTAVVHAEHDPDGLMQP